MCWFSFIITFMSTIYRVITVLQVLLLSVSLVPLLGSASVEAVDNLDGQRTEIISSRDEYTKYYKVTDSTTQRGYRIIGETSTQKVHYQSGNSYYNIDNNIVSTFSSDYSYKNSANDFDVYFGNTIQDGFRYIYDNVDTVFGNIVISDYILNNSVAVVSGSTIIYKDVLPGVDIKYTVVTDGIFKEVVLKNKTALKYDFTNTGIVVGDYDGLAAFDSINLNGEELSLKDGKLSRTKDPASAYSFQNNLKNLKINTQQQEGNVTQDTFASPSAVWEGVYVSQNNKPLFAGNYYDPVPDAWDMNSRTYLKFPAINQPISKAQLRVYHYGTTGSNFTANIKKVSRDFNETVLKWDYKPSLSGNYGDFYFPAMIQQANTIARESGYIDTQLINNQLGTGRVLIGLQSQNEALTKGVVFCSKDWPASHCNGKAPVLVYELNYPPLIPIADEPNNGDYFSAGCDLSAGDVCDAVLTIDYNISNIADGEKDFDDATNKTKVKVQISVDDVSFADLADYTPDFVYNYTAVSATTPDGVWYWRAVVVDEYGATSLENPSQTISKKFITDSTPPTIPRIDLPEYTAGTQISFDLSQVSTDNIALQDGANEIISYQLEVSDLEDFSNTVYLSPFINTTIDNLNPTFTVTGLADDVQYFYRVKSADRHSDFIIDSASANISNWSDIQSSIQDDILPVINNIDLDYTRFSPSNQTSIGQKDSIKIEFDYIEKNFNFAKIEVKNSDGIVIRTIDSCSLNSGSLIACNFTNVLDDFGNLAFVWDGKNDIGNYVSDGVYNLKIILEDKAGQVEFDSSQLVFLDDTGANIGIAAPKNDYWTNQDSINFSGSVGVIHIDGKEDKDFAKLELQTNGLEWQDITTFVDSTQMFSFDSNLELGQNEFVFRSTDTVGNKIENIGNPQEQTDVIWYINHETISPSLLSVSPVGLMQNGSENRDLALAFSLQDNLVLTGDQSQTSGLQAGTNPSSYIVNLLSSVDDGLTWTTIPVFANGQVFIGDELVCVSENDQRSSVVNCSISITNFQPDGLYKLDILTVDIAGNSLQITDGIIQPFEIDSHTFLQVNSPINGSSLTYDDVDFAGVGEFGSEVTLTNSQTDIVYTFLLNSNTTKAGKTSQSGADLSEVGVDISCGIFQDIDGNPNTKLVEICQWSLSVLQANNFDNPDSSIVNNNLVVLTDFAGNVATEEVQLIVDLYAINLSVSSNLQYISPNGDGRQDGAIFTTAVSSSLDSNGDVLISEYIIKLTDSSGIDVWFETGSILPDQIFFSGKDNYGNWISDGDYTYTLTIKTVDGVEVNTVPQPILSLTDIDDEIIITAPYTGWVTSRSAFNVQGQAPSDMGVDLCVDIVTTPNSVKCDFVQTAEVDSFGFWQTVVVALDGKDSQIFVSAIAKDNYGNQTPRSNEVEIIRTVSDPFKSVSITPAFGGINSEEDINAFLSGDLTLDQIRSLQIKTVVTKHTQAVDIGYADWTNIVELPNTNPATGISDSVLDSNHFATITNQIEDLELLNPSNDPSVKKSFYPQSGAELSGNQCENAECHWIYNYALPSNLTSGQYELGFTGYKGGVVQSATAGFVLDSRVVSAPRVLRVEKSTDLDWSSARQFDYKYYSNTQSIRLTGVADISASVDILIDGAVVDTVMTSSTGIWQSDILLPDFDNQYDITLAARVGFSTEESLETVAIILDRVAPQLVSVLTQSAGYSVNPHISTGDRVGLTASFDEALWYAQLTNDDGVFDASLNLLRDGGDLYWYVQRQEQGVYYSTFTLQDIAGNTISYANNSTDSDINILVTSNEITYKTEARLESLDFRLFVDNADSNNPYIKVDNWGRSKGGFESSDNIPEMDRLMGQFVTKNNSIKIYGYAEKNQRVLMYSKLSKNSLENTVNDMEFLKVINVSDQDCSKKGIAQTTGNYVTKFAEVCKWEYEFEFDDDGKSPLGIPKSWYMMQVKTVDLAGNISTVSPEIIIYHDTQSPEKYFISNVSSSSYQQDVSGWESDCSKGCNPATRDVEIDLKQFGERKADVRYNIIKL